MKIICTQENLSRGLQLVSHIASKNISLPILNNVLIKAEGGTITLMTTNLEIGVVCQIRGKVEQGGSFTVQAKTLSDYVGLLPRENVSLELTDQGLRIGCKNAKTVMRGTDPSEFPLIPAVEEKDSYTVKAQQLKVGLSAVVFAVALDETRPEISGVYMDFQGDTLTLVATDSYRLAEKKVALANPAAKPQHMIVPLRTIQELVRMLSSEADETISIVCNENQVLFVLGAAKLTSRLIEGQYPDYTQIIPREHSTSATAPTAELVTTVKRASLFCRAGGNDVSLKLDSVAGAIIVSATNVQVGESEATQPAEIEGEANSIIFNYRFLLDGLQNVGDEECVIEINSAKSPGLLKPKDDASYLYIIMPIKQ